MMKIWKDFFVDIELYPLTPGEMPEEKKAFYSKEVKRLAELAVDWIETDQQDLVWKNLHSWRNLPQFKAKA